MKKVLFDECVRRFLNIGFVTTIEQDEFGEWDYVENVNFKPMTGNILKLWDYWVNNKCKECFAPTWYNYDDCPMINTMYQRHKTELFEYLEIDEKIPCKGMSFYTIVPKERLEYSSESIALIAEFSQDMFEQRFDKYFYQMWYVIESGKHQNRPNLHLHCLCDFKKGGSKFFLRDLKHKWKQYFPEDKYTINYDIEGNKGIHRVDCNTLEIQNDKVDYMDNELKGSHENFTDLGIRKYLKSEV